MFWKLFGIVLLVAVAVGFVVQRTVMDSEFTTIARLQGQKVSQGMVTLEGTITYTNNENVFILDDGTGSVELATCPVWYKRINIYQGDEVVVIGQPMRNLSLRTKSDLVLSVYEIRKGGEEIIVRGGPGKPPWSSTRLPESHGY